MSQTISREMRLKPADRVLRAVRDAFPMGLTTAQVRDRSHCGITRCKDELHAAEAAGVIRRRGSAWVAVPPGADQ